MKIFDVNMRFESAELRDEFIGIDRSVKSVYPSSYIENYQKYIDEFCTPPNYKRDNSVKVGSDFDLFLGESS